MRVPGVGEGKAAERPGREAAEGMRAGVEEGTTGGSGLPPAADAPAPAGSPDAADARSSAPALPPSRSRPGATSTPLVSTSQLRVRYVETDQMGFAHHSNYFAWFEIGRTDFIRELGTSYARLEREGLRLAIAEAMVRYLQAARYDDVLEVRTWLERVQSRSVTFGYEVTRTDPQPRARVATATMKLIALDAKGTPRTLPPEFRRRLEDVVTQATS